MLNKKISQESLLLRNAYPMTVPNEFPIVRRQEIPVIQKVISFGDTRSRDKRAECLPYLVHFFKEDACFEYLFGKPGSTPEERAIARLSQYAAVCSPDFSLYPEMPLSEQKHQVFKNRWCAARWQKDFDLNVVPTVSWADERSFEFCFEGLPTHATVVVSTVGSHQYPQEFLRGYDRMLEILEPNLIFCYGTPFKEMEGNIITFSYRAFCKKEGA